MSAAKIKADFLENTSPRILGESFDIGLRNLRNEGGNLTGATGTVTLYDSAGTTTLAATALTLSGDEATYFLRTGAGLTITAAGTYRAVYALSRTDLRTRTWQQTIVIRAKPYS